MPVYHIDDIPTQLTAPATNDRFVARDTSASKDRFVLFEQLFDINLRNDVLLVDASFSAYPFAPNRYATIGAALTACTGGETVLIAPGIYTEDLTMGDDGVTLMGCGRPRYDSATGRLVGGTIIRGRISMSNTKWLTIRDLGVDLVGVNSTDCLASSNVTGDVYRSFFNLALLGNGYDALAHGLYGAGAHGEVNNVWIYNCHHGMAVHNKYWNISNVFFYRCSGTSLILKSKGVGNVHHINISNIILEGDPTGADYKLHAGPLMLQADDVADSVEHINIVNVTANYCVNGVIQTQVINTGVVVDDITITNVTSKNNMNLSGFGDYWFREGSNINLYNCRSFDRQGGVGFNLDPAGSATNVRVRGALADTSGSGTHAGSFPLIEVNGKVGRKFTTLTIATGAITVTGELHEIDTEAAAATDDLDTINGGIDGMEITLFTANSSRDVTVKHNTGNIQCGSDRVLTSNRDVIRLRYLVGTSSWQMISFADNL